MAMFVYITTMSHLVLVRLAQCQPFISDEIGHHAIIDIKQELPAFLLRHDLQVSLVLTLQAVEAIDSERDVLQAELDSKAEQVANLTEELELGHQQADDANRQAHMY